MPRLPRRPCAHPGCPELVQPPDRWCDKHRAQHEQRQRQDEADYDRRRGSSTQRGYDSRWAKIRAMILAERPLCEDCLKMNPRRLTPGVEVHHIDKGAAEKGIHDPARLIVLCKAHHSTRTARGE